MATKHTTPVTALLDVLVPALGETNAAVSTSVLTMGHVVFVLFIKIAAPTSNHG
jgi:hypothetical protein